MRRPVGPVRSNGEQNISYFVCFFLDISAPGPYIGPVNARNAPAAAHGRLSRCPKCRSLRRRSARTGYKKAATDLTGRSGCTTRRFPSVRDTHPQSVDRRREDVEKKSISRPVYLSRPNSGICRAAQAEISVFRHFRRALAPAHRFDRSDFENRGIENMFLYGADCCTVGGRFFHSAVAPESQHRAALAVRWLSSGRTRTRLHGALRWLRLRGSRRRPGPRRGARDRGPPRPSVFKERQPPMAGFAGVCSRGMAADGRAGRRRRGQRGLR